MVPMTTSGPRTIIVQCAMRTIAIIVTLPVADPGGGGGGAGRAPLIPWGTDFFILVLDFFKMLKGVCANRNPKKSMHRFS